MKQYVGKSNNPLSPEESREAVSRFYALPADWSARRRQLQVAADMTYNVSPAVVRYVSKDQVMRAVQRKESGGDARCERHRNMKVPATDVKKHRRRSRNAMPTETKNLIVQLVLATCTLTAPQLRNEIHYALGETWSSSAIAKARTAAGFTRKRTVAKKCEACPIQQHNHAEALINLQYHAEHFVFIDGKDAPACSRCQPAPEPRAGDADCPGWWCCVETHKAARDWYPQYGYARSGCPAYVEMEGPINVSFSTLAAMSVDGMIGWRTTAYHAGQGDVHGRRGQDTGCFLENFCSCVLPYLRPFPEPCSVVVLDNSRYALPPITPLPSSIRH
jgi:hypothetical protein